MAFGNHAFNNGGIRVRGVNGTFAEIVAGHKERSMKAELLQDVQQLVSVQVRSVVECQGYHVCLCAVEDIVIICYLSEEWPWIVQRRRSRWCGAGVTGTELPLAVRIGAIVFARATVSLDPFSPRGTEK